MMAVVLLTQNDLHPFNEQFLTAGLMLTIVAVAYVLMRFAGAISRVIGPGGASIISRVMGMILASVAAAEVLAGVREYFG
jgi:multiple antibiotic resistance protein